MEESKVQKRLYRSRNKMIGGVCGGLAEYFGMDPSILRIVVTILALLTTVAPVVLGYIVAWIVIPVRRG